MDAKLGHLSSCCQEFSQGIFALLSTHQNVSQRLLRGIPARMHLGSSPQCYTQLQMPISSSAIMLESYSNVTKNSSSKDFPHKHHNCVKYDQMVTITELTDFSPGRIIQNEQKRSD